MPDVLPAEILGRDFSLVAGDFEEVYGKDSDEEEPQHGLWDAVVTCFFLDTVGFALIGLRLRADGTGEGQECGQLPSYHSQDSQA